MDKTFEALGGLLLNALPTFFLVLFLHFYLKKMFYGPLERLLKARYDASEGARKLAEESLVKAEQKAAEYEAALRTARGEIYREQEETRRKWLEDQSRTLQLARQEAEAGIAKAKQQLASELETAKRSLGAESETLAAAIAKSILERKAA